MHSVSASPLELFHPHCPGEALWVAAADTSFAEDGYFALAAARIACFWSGRDVTLKTRVVITWCEVESGSGKMMMMNDDVVIIRLETRVCLFHARLSF